MADSRGFADDFRDFVAEMGVRGPSLGGAFSGNQSGDKPEGDGLPDDVVRRGELPEEAIRRMDLISEQASVNDKRRAEFSHLKKGTPEYAAAMAEFKQKAIPEAIAIIFDGEPNKLPVPAIAGRKWFNALPPHRQFYFLPHVCRGLTAFGNGMVHAAADYQLLWNLGALFKYQQLLVAVSHTAFAGRQHLGPRVLIAGDASIGKSYLSQTTGNMLFPGVVSKTHHSSTLARTSGVDKCRVRIREEVAGGIFGGTAESRRTGEHTGSALAKNLATDNHAGVVRLMRDPETNHMKAMETIAVSSGTDIECTNDRLPEDAARNPMLARYILLRPPSLSAGDRYSILRLQGTFSSQKIGAHREFALHRCQLRAWYVFLVEQLIAMRALEDVEMSAFSIYEMIIRNYLNDNGHETADPKQRVKVEALLRALVIGNACNAALASEPMIGTRRREGTGEFIPFLENATRHFLNIESFLYAQQPEIVFAITMCSTLFGDEVQPLIVEAVRRSLAEPEQETNNPGSKSSAHEMSNTDVDPSCADGSIEEQIILQRHSPLVEVPPDDPQEQPHVMHFSKGKEASVSKLKVGSLLFLRRGQFDTPDYNYVEIRVADQNQQGMKGVVDILKRNMGTSTTSNPNVERALKDMHAKTTVHRPYHIVKGELVEDERSSRFEFRQILLVKDQTAHSMRVYIDVHLLFHSGGVNRVLYDAVKQITSHYQPTVTHVLCLPLYGPEWNPRLLTKDAVKPEVIEFPGLYATIKLSQRKYHVPVHRNYHAQTSYALESVTSAFESEQEVLTDDMASTLCESAFYWDRLPEYQAAFLLHTNAGTDGPDTHYTVFHEWSELCRKTRAANRDAFPARFEYNYPRDPLSEVQGQNYLATLSESRAEEQGIPSGVAPLHDMTHLSRNAREVVSHEEMERLAEDELSMQAFLDTRSIVRSQVPVDQRLAQFYEVAPPLFSEDVPAPGVPLPAPCPPPPEPYLSDSEEHSVAAPCIDSLFPDDDSPFDVDHAVRTAGEPIVRASLSHSARQASLMHLRANQRGLSVRGLKHRLEDVSEEEERAMLRRHRTDDVPAAMVAAPDAIAVRVPAKPMPLTASGWGADLDMASGPDFDEPID